MLTIDSLLKKIDNIVNSRSLCTVGFPDGSEVITEDPYAAIATYITDYLWEHEIWGGDQVVVLNTDADEHPDEDSWITTIGYSNCEGKMGDFLDDFYEGQKRINLIAFTSLDNVGDAIMTDTKIEYIGKD